uniref:Uncharacterized protein n=1 Tax=Trichogramma kaykai TaxID=54128 RepID=A0ABD2WSV4_9HYME
MQAYYTKDYQSVAKGLRILCNGFCYRPKCISRERTACIYILHDSIWSNLIRTAAAAVVAAAAARLYTYIYPRRIGRSTKQSERFTTEKVTRQHVPYTEAQETSKYTHAFLPALTQFSSPKAARPGTNAQQVKLGGLPMCQTEARLSCQHGHTCENSTGLGCALGSDY